jgi:hypothetical protein
VNLKNSLFSKISNIFGGSENINSGANEKKVEELKIVE